ADNETGFTLERASGDLQTDPAPGFDVADYSAQSNDGTLEPSSISGPAANASGFYNFDGADDFIEIPDSAGMDLGTGHASFSVWVRFDTLPPQSYNGTHLGGLVVDGVLGPYTGAGIFISNQQFSFQVRTASGTTASSTSDAGHMDAQWHHVVGVLDRNSSTGVMLYVDGVLQSQTGNGSLFSGVSLDNSLACRVGGGRSTSNNLIWPFKGDMDAVRLYRGTALSASDVSTLYAAGREAPKDQLDSADLHLFMPFTQSANSWSSVATPTSNTTVYADASVAAGTEYHYRIKATNSFGASGYSNIASDTTPGTGGGGGSAPAAPSGLNITAVTESQIDLAWADNADNETGFTLERASGDLQTDPAPGFDVADYSAQSNDGTLEPSSISGPAANASGFYNFDGADDFIEIPDSAGMDLGTD
ncbi:MAG: LamG domain-containing protein, partial [Sulfitobacter sp.]|nr:LamG domain-containing protein [Sulfitobacter sp.]